MTRQDEEKSQVQPPANQLQQPCDRPLAMGREFTRARKGGFKVDKLIGGGPGILLSRGAFHAISKATCT
jgi:hypothetical protein